MSYDVTCGSCGKTNPLGRLYCMKCGTKLDVSEKSVARAQLRDVSRRLPVSVRLLRMLVTGGLLAVLILVLLPTTPAGRVGSPNDAGTMARKLTNLRDTMREDRSAAYRISELELNAYLVAILKKSPPSSSWGFDLQRINVALGVGELHVLLETVRGPFTLTQELRVVPVHREGRWQFEVAGMRMGRLPLPAMLAVPLAARSAGAFDSLAREREVMERLAVFEVNTGWIQVASKTP